MTNNSSLQQPAGSGSNINLEFGGDYSYSLNRGLFKSNVMGLPTGAAQLVSGGHSIANVRVVEGIVAIPDGDSPDKILWTVMDELVRLYTRSSDITRLRLYLDSAGGYVEVDGWIDGYNATRDAVDGHAVIKVTFDFIIQSKNTSNL